MKAVKRNEKQTKGMLMNLAEVFSLKQKTILSLLKSLLGTSDLKYKAVADQLANEIMQCGIDYFNESQENDSGENYLESSQKTNKIS